MKRDITSYFEGVIENIDIILEKDFYKKEDKENFKNIKTKIINWYDNYKKNKTLKNIEPKEIEFIDLEITDFFDKYLVIEPINENYSERLSYDFGKLEILWKEEMLGGK